MAEFQEVCKQWRRMCYAGSDGFACSSCKMYTEIDVSICRGIPDEDEAAIIEKHVMGWAEKHPEKVYPTFADLMYDAFLKWCQENYPGRAKDEKAWFDYLYETRIPEEMAQKLGIKPKEG